MEYVYDLLRLRKNTITNRNKYSTFFEFFHI